MKQLADDYARYSPDTTLSLEALKRAELHAAIDELIIAERERCAVKAWTYYMDQCKKRGISPANFGEWCCAGAIRGESK